MDFWTAIQERHSVRAFTGQDVDRATVDRIVAAGIRAPSGGNRQPWHFYVVRNAATRQDLARAAGGQSFVAEAPVVIVVCADPERSAARYRERGRDLYCLQDTAAAVEHMLLAAVALGLGGCWVGAFDERAAAAALDLPGHLRPVAMLPLGVPAADTGARTSRRPLEEVTTYLD